MPQRHRQRSTVSSQRPLEDILTRRPKPQDNDEYVIRDPDGDYVESIESTGWETVPFHATWTKHEQFAKVFKGHELWMKSSETVLTRLMHGHAGLTTILIRKAEQ
jgi:hypothetical protein